MFSSGKVGFIGRTYNHFNRYRQIIKVFIKYGFGELLDVLKIEQYLESGLQLMHLKTAPNIDKLLRDERIRLIFEELGTTFIKMGQILSTRPDLIPISLITELQKLQNNIPSFPFTEVETIFQFETGKSINEVFDEIEETPIAAASIGQVHKAKLKDGTSVILKVQRPNIKITIETDLEIMLYIAKMIKKHFSSSEIFQPVKIVEEFKKQLIEEIDYTLEAAHMQIFHRYFKNDKTFYIPKIYKEFCTEKILIMEYIDGIFPLDTKQLKEKNLDLKLIAKRGANHILKQIFLYGYFHADPHPGNLFILENNVICYIDFGMIGYITKEERDSFAELAIKIFQKNERKITSLILQLSIHPANIDIENFERDVSRFIEENLYLSLKEIKPLKIVKKLFKISENYGIKIKPHLFLMLKALGSVDTMGRNLDPDFEIISLAKPFIQKIYINRYNPKTFLTSFFDSTYDTLKFLTDFPNEMKSIIQQIRKKKLRIGFEHKGLEPLMTTLNHITNRLVFAIILSALIIGSSLIVLSQVPPKWNGIPIIGLAGFVLAGIMGLWLLFIIIRKGKM